MAGAFNPFALARRRPVSATLAVLFAALALLALFLRYWITTDSGRDFVISQIDGREIAGYGRLSIRKLEGDPLADFSVGSIEVRDASGVWLSAETTHLSWSPLRLLSRTVDLKALSIAEVNVLRRPVRAPRPETGRKPWEVRLGKATIDRLFLAEGVAGPESASAITARFLNERNGSIDAQLQISPLEGAGDRIDARILRDQSSEFNLEVDGVAPAGGVFAHLLRLPENASAVVAATAAGNLDNGRGEARLTVDGSDKLFASGKIENGTVDANLRVDAGALPIPADLATFLGPMAEADLTATFEKSAVAFNVVSRLAAGTVDIAARSRTDRFELTEPAKVKANLATLAPFWDAPRLFQLDGTLEQRSTGWQYSGETRLEVRPDADLPFEAVAGPLTVSLDGGRIPFTGDLKAYKVLTSNAQVSRILGDEVRISGNGVFDIASRRLLVDAAEITHKTGNAQLLGEAGFADNTLNVSGKVAQSISALPGGFGGTAAGFVQAKGNLRDFDLGLNLNLASLTTSFDDLKPLIDGRGTIRGLVRIRPEAGDIRRLDFRLPGLEGQANGRIYGPGSPDLRVTARQLKRLEISGSQVDLSALSVRVTRQGSGMLVAASSEGGRALVSGRSVSDLTAVAEIYIEDGDLSGPVTLTGRSDGQASAASFVLDRRGETTRFNNIEGRLGSIEFTGSAALVDGGSLEADLEAEAGAFQIGGITFGSLSLKGTGGRQGDTPFDVGATFEARDIKLTENLTIDAVTGTLTTVAEGYRFDGRMTDSQVRANTDLNFRGLVALADGPPSGRLSLSGTLLGIAITTREDIQWSLGPSPTLDADVSLLGGRLQARLHPGNETNSSSLTMESLSIAPVLAVLGYPAIEAVISGRANGRLYGEAPEGVMEMSATSAVSGLNTRIDLKMNGRLDRRALTFTAQSNYGPDMKANAAGRLPVMASANSIVQFNQERPIEVLVEVNGDLESVRLIALAYGHDVGGTLSSRTEIGGALSAPRLKSDAKIRDGIYEYGATGMGLKDLDVDASLDEGVLTLTGRGAGADGGTLEMSGRLAEAEAGVSVKFNRILVYDRLGDFARISGDAKLTEGETDRVLSGALVVNDARFNIDSFAGNSIRTLNVRWTTDDPDAPRETLLEKPIRLALDVTAPRGVIVRGRGLDSDWGVNLDVTGRPDSILLNGRATLVRGTLELAQRPFEFDTGQITFDGPVDTARMAISATREVDGFSVRADVSGAPARPTIELTSTPPLPQDEILSRMLFNRSSVDLTALEAAELATSIARLAGQDTGIDPIGALQDGLGLDRLRFGIDNAGNAEVGVGQYLASDVYLEVTTQGAAGNSVEVEWQPRPQVSVSSETNSTGESRVSVRWKKDY
ncbi:translocation/assembly module TamB domain-containing protein [Hyphomonas sp.]|uniref:translocation/assembly module TamB domain-containing protein n=1 Tax=Hyphomonas sp. TaxID=87 RepID=UPI0025BA9C2A|nr:translocation/assembly module TamB domain-containing protein [Hyphomonas sp.]